MQHHSTMMMAMEEVMKLLIVLNRPLMSHIMDTTSELRLGYIQCGKRLSYYCTMMMAMEEVVKLLIVLNRPSMSHIMDTRCELRLG